MKFFSTTLSGSFVLGACIAAAPGMLSAQNMGGMGAGKNPDMKFAMAAAQGGQAEVAMGKMAAEKGSNPEVKAFGQQMVDDHTKANDQLQTLAQSDSLTLPTDMSPKEKATCEKLSKLSGAEFDKAYVSDMVKDHDEDIREFQKEAASGKDEKLKGFASDTLPVLKVHLSKIESIKSKMSSGTSGM